MQLKSHTATDQQGVERCQNVIQAAIENVKGHPEKGYRQAKAYCNQPMTLSVSEKRKICPRCYKEPVVGFPEPRVTNASGVGLSAKEMEECGLNPDGTRIDGKEIVRVSAETPEISKAVEAKVESKKDEVILSTFTALIVGALIYQGVTTLLNAKEHTFEKDSIVLSKK